MSTLYPGVKLSVKLEMPERSITTDARIVRQVKANSITCAVCRFLTMNSEDREYFFEFIYGKPFSPVMDEAPFLVGQA